MDNVQEEKLTLAEFLATIYIDIVVADADWMEHRRECKACGADAMYLVTCHSTISNQPQRREVCSCHVSDWLRLPHTDVRRKKIARFGELSLVERLLKDL